MAEGWVMNILNCISLIIGTGSVIPVDQSVEDFLTYGQKYLLTNDGDKTMTVTFSNGSVIYVDPKSAIEAVPYSPIAFA